MKFVVKAQGPQYQYQVVLASYSTRYYDFHPDPRETYRRPYLPTQTPFIQTFWAPRLVRLQYAESHFSSLLSDIYSTFTSHINIIES